MGTGGTIVGISPELRVHDPGFVQPCRSHGHTKPPMKLDRAVTGLTIRPAATLSTSGRRAPRLSGVIVPGRIVARRMSSVTVLSCCLRQVLGLSARTATSVTGSPVQFFAVQLRHAFMRPAPLAGAMDRAAGAAGRTRLSSPTTRSWTRSGGLPGVRGYLGAPSVCARAVSDAAIPPTMKCAFWPGMAVAVEGGHRGSSSEPCRSRLASGRPRSSTRPGIARTDSQTL